MIQINGSFKDKLRLGRERWFAWLSAVGSVLLCLVISFGWPYVKGDSRWITPWDWVWGTIAAQDISRGNLSQVYFNHQINSLPGFNLLLAPFTAVGDHIGLTTGYPLSLISLQPNPSMWLLIGPITFILGAAVIPCIDHLAAGLEMPVRRRKVASVLIGTLVVPPTCVIAGHPEDLLSIGLACLGISSLLAGSWRRAAWLIALAILIQPLAGLLLPAFLAFTPSGQRMAVLWRMTLPPLVCALVFICADPPDSITDLVLQPEVGTGQPLPWVELPTRHLSLWVGYGVADVKGGTGVRSLAVVAAVAAGVWLFRRPTPRRLLQASALSLLARPLLESQVWCWYLAPAAIVTLVLVGVNAESDRKWLIGTVSCGLFYGVPAGAYVHFPDTVRMPSFLALLLMLVFLLVVATSTQRSSDPTRLPEMSYYP